MMDKPLARVMDFAMLVIRINVMVRCFRQHHAFRSSMMCFVVPGSNHEVNLG
jgi:hypothetical protein